MYDEFNENDNLITEFDEEWDNTPEDIEIPEDEDLNPEDYEKYYTEVYMSGKLSIDEDPENFRITEEVIKDNKILLGKDVNFLIEPSKEEDRQTAIRVKGSENVRAVCRRKRMGSGLCKRRCTGTLQLKPGKRTGKEIQQTGLHAQNRTSETLRAKELRD